MDLIDVLPFRDRFEGREEILREVFSDEELAYCRSQCAPWPHLAARFAAKEATWKALGSGLAGAMAWSDVEVTRDVAGAPGLVITGATAGALAGQGLSCAAVSLSHTDVGAIAVVLLT